MDTKEYKRISVKKVISFSLRLLLGLIVAFLVFVACTLAYDKYVKRSQIPSFFGTSVLIIATPSMSGAIDAGDVVIIRASDTYEVGDVITYFPASDKISVTHRIVRIEGEKYYSKGDANESEDPDPIFKTQIVGKMVGRIPKVGIVIEWLRTWQGIAFLIAVGAVIVALVIVAGKSEDTEEKEISENSSNGEAQINVNISAVKEEDTKSASATEVSGEK